MGLFYDLAVAILASVIFYLFQIYIPEKRKKKHLKRYFENSVFIFRFKIITSLLRLAEDKTPLSDQITFIDSLAKDRKLCASYFSPEKMGTIMLNVVKKENQSELKGIVSDLSILEENIKHLSTSLVFLSDKNLTDNISSMLHIIHPYLNLHHPETSSDEQINKIRGRDFEVKLITLLRDHLPYLLYGRQPFSKKTEYEEDPLLEPLQDL